MKLFLVSLVVVMMTCACAPGSELVLVETTQTKILLVQPTAGQTAVVLAGSGPTWTPQPPNRPANVLVLVQVTPESQQDLLDSCDPPRPPAIRMEQGTSVWLGDKLITNSGSQILHIEQIVLGKNGPVIGVWRLDYYGAPIDLAKLGFCASYSGGTIGLWYRSTVDTPLPPSNLGR